MQIWNSRQPLYELDITRMLKSDFKYCLQICVNADFANAKELGYDP